MEKSSNGFRCKQCSFKTDSVHARQMIYLHIRKKHQNPTKSDKNIKNTSSLNNLKPKESRQKIEIVKLNNLPVIQPVETIEKNQCNLQNENVQEKSTECTQCQETVHNFDWNKHTERCQEAFKYMDGQTCLICEIEFDSVTEVANHIKKEHLDIIIVMEKISDVSQKTEVKQEIINLEEENDYISPILDENKSRPKTSKIKSEVKEEIIDLDDLNDCTENGSSFNNQTRTFDRGEPQELTTIYTCPMCYKKYASLSDLESHISLFHRIPKKVQRQSMQGGKSMAIITQSL